MVNVSTNNTKTRKNISSDKRISHCKLMNLVFMIFFCHGFYSKTHAKKYLLVIAISLDFIQRYGYLTPSGFNLEKLISNN